MKFIIQDEKTDIFLSDFVFNQNFNKTLVHQVITAYSSSSRQGSKSQKNKSEVSGSGKKPWRQKGTGRARVGSIRSPIWRSGGVTFAAKPRSYIKKINKKVYRSALRSIFSALIQQNRLIILKNFSILYPKTKLLVKKLNKISLQKVLIITKNLDKNLFFASRNLYQVCIQDVQSINPVDLIRYKNTIVTLNAIKKIEERLL